MRVWHIGSSASLRRRSYWWCPRQRSPRTSPARSLPGKWLTSPGRRCRASRSPGAALQLPITSSTTGTDGSDELGDLPPGAYELRFELSGVQTFNHEELRLNAG